MLSQLIESLKSYIMFGLAYTFGKRKESWEPNGTRQLTKVISYELKGKEYKKSPQQD